MKFFEKLKVQSASDRLLEEELYETVLDELNRGVKRDGLWAKSIAKSAGDDKKAKSLYIEYRVQSIKDEAELAKQLHAQRRREAEAARLRDEKAAQQKALEEAKEREQKLLLKAKEILANRGYKVRRVDEGWMVYEPLGGKVTLATTLEVYDYALSKKHGR